jgi:glucose dehydrogenase
VHGREGVEANYIAGTPYVGANVKMYAGPGRQSRRVHAWDPVRARGVEIKENFPVWSGALVTAGDVVFYGTMDGWFKAVDARTGELLWQFKTAPGSSASRSPIAGPTASSTSPCSSGVGGWAGAIVAGDLDRATPPRRSASSTR